MSPANYRLYQTLYLRHQQRGVAMPLVVIGLLAIMAVAGLALDSSHAVANKTRLQNSVDAAALAAAKVISLPGTTGQATTAAMNILGQNADGDGNHELNDAWDGGEIATTIQFSATLNPFVPGSPTGPYVRVIAQNFNVQTSLSRVLGIDQIPVAASAVAGPSPTIDTACNAAPIVVCAADVNADLFGFESDELQVLKPGPGAGGHDDVGPGNYKLLRLDCGSGGGAGPCLRENMAGGYSQCLSDDETVETEPGVMAGPSIQGFNTRFGTGGGGGLDTSQYPPDVVTQTPNPYLTTDRDSFIVYQNGQPKQYANDINYSYNMYVSASQNGPHQNPPPTGAYGRRVIALPVTNCTGDETGQSTLDVYGFACFFLLQPILGGPNKEIFGQFVEDCVSGGTPGPDPNDAEGPYIIQLYKDPDSDDS